MQHINGQQFIQALCLGENRAYQSLYRLYAASLFRIIRKIVKSDTNAEDLLQDTFIKILRNIRLYKPEKGKLYSWLSCVAKNTAIDYRKSPLQEFSGHCEELESRIEELEELDPVTVNINGIGLVELLNVLAGSSRVIVRMTYFEGHTHAEVARRLNMPLGTVKSKLRAAKTFLRGCFYDSSATP